MRLFAKSPRDIARQAEGRQRPVAPPGPVDPAARPSLASDEEENAYLDACAGWLAHVASGRIEVK
jgi:hypothetical protein